MATRVNRWTALLLGLSILAAGASSSGCASRGTNASNMDAADSAGSNQPVDTPPPAELRIVFVSDAGSGTDLYAMRPDGSATIRITVDPETDFGPRVRRDELVFGSLRAGRSILYRIVPGETPAEVYRNPGREEVPDWSPDGEWMAFSTERDFNIDIFLARPDGTPQRRLTSDPGHDTSPRWSPDGSQLVFVSDRAGQDDLFVIDFDGSTERNLTRSPEDEGHPSWSPDGRSLLFSRTATGGAPDIFRLDIETGGVVNLTNSPGWDAVSSWSPEGDRIAFTSNRDGNWEIYSMDPAGGDVRRLTNSPGFDGDPVWIRGTWIPAKVDDETR